MGHSVEEVGAGRESGVGGTRWNLNQVGVEDYAERQIGSPGGRSGVAVGPRRVIGPRGFLPCLSRDPRMALPLRVSALGSPWTPSGPLTSPAMLGSSLVSPPLLSLQLVALGTLPGHVPVRLSGWTWGGVDPQSGWGQGRPWTGQGPTRRLLGLPGLRAGHVRHPDGHERGPLVRDGVPAARPAPPHAALGAGREPRHLGG